MTIIKTKPIIGLLIPLLTSSFLGCGAGNSVPSTDNPILCDLIDEVRWIDHGDDEGVSVDLTLNSLSIRDQGSVDFHLRIPQSSALVLQQADTDTGRSTTLEIEITDTFDRTILSETIKCPSGAVSLPINFESGENLDPTTSRVCRLRLTSRATQGEGPIRLFSPTIRSLAQTPPGAGASPGSSAQGVAAAPPQQKPDIFVYLIDTLRSDSLGAYRNDRGLTPNFDRFAEHATVYEKSVAQSPWTRPSVASIFTGLEPHLHTVQSGEDALPEEAVTLAERLSECGYRTAAFVTNGNVSEFSGFAQGFDHFWRSSSGRVTSDIVNEQVIQFLAEQPNDRPLFCYIHTMDPHAPYIPPNPFRERFARGVTREDLGELEALREVTRRGKQLVRLGKTLEPDLIDQVRSLYDAEVALNDHSFGALVEHLKRLGLYDPAALIVVSDHGEEFWEHGGRAHGHSFYREVMDVPLIIKAPDQKSSARSPRLAQHIDLYRTILGFVGEPVPDTIRGRSLRDPDPQPPVCAFAHLDLTGHTGISITDEEWKLILPRSEKVGREPMLYNLANDPNERENLYDKVSIATEYMLNQARRLENPAQGSPLERVNAEVDDALVDQLRALGYVDS